MNLENLFLQCISRNYQNTLGAVSYAIDKRDGELRIWFESSNGAIDWIRNLNFPALPYGDCKHLWFCHRGFLSAWKEVRPHLRDAIMDKSVEQITIVGYSHGAAVALLCHEYACFNRTDIATHIEGVGFGCPRVVWGPVPKSVSRRFKRFLVVRNRNDIVTHLPPVLFGFHHVSPVLEIGKKGRYTKTDAHRPENYQKELQSM